MAIGHVVTRGYGTGTFVGELRQVVTRGFFDSNLPPVLVEQIGNISAGFDTGTHEYDLSGYFTGETSYAIAPAVETGWSFATDTGLLTIDTDDEGTFGPYVVTASNNTGDTDSNAFTVKVSQSAGAYLPGFVFTFRIGF
jgi:hypothetical protein